MRFVSFGRNADALIAHANDRKVLVLPADFHLDVNVLARVLHGVVEQVENRAAKMIGIANDLDRFARSRTQAATRRAAR